MVNQTNYFGKLCGKKTVWQENCAARKQVFFSEVDGIDLVSHP